MLKQSRQRSSNKADTAETQQKQKGNNTETRHTTKQTQSRHKAETEQTQSRKNAYTKHTKDTSTENTLMKMRFKNSANMVPLCELNKEIPC